MAWPISSGGDNEKKIDLRNIQMGELHDAFDMKDGIKEGYQECFFQCKLNQW